MVCVRRLAAVSVVVVFGLLQAATAHGQVVADPDYWKQTEARSNTVYRFFYDQSPQSIPSNYDPVAEAEQILRQRQAALPTSSPEAKSIFRRGWDILRSQELAPAARRLFAVGLGATAFEVGWKIGSGINAKLLHLGLPGSDDTTIMNPRLEFVLAGTDLHTNHVMPYDGWVFAFDTPCCKAVRHWFEYVDPNTDRCSKFVVQPPDDWGEILRSYNTSACWRGWFQDPETAPTNTLAAIAPENALVAPGPIEDYTDQPYTYETPAPTPPPQTTVEQGIEDELAKPESELLQHWLNYHLGSPGETDPLGIDVPNSEIEFVDWFTHWEDHGHEFSPPYDDAEEYRRDATEIVERKQNGDPGILHCRREGDDPADLYWDTEKEAIVVVKDGKITTYFVPDRGFDYWIEECNK